MSERYILVGAHLRSHGEYDGVTFFDLDEISVSGIAFDPHLGAAARETVERVAPLRQTMTAHETFIAFRYGSTAGGKAEVEEKCGSQATKWREVLERRAGMVEFTLKVAPPTKVLRPRKDEVSGGADYLRRLHEARSIALDDDFRALVDRELGALAHESRWSRRSDGGHEFVALVERSAVSTVEAAGHRIQESFPDTPFLLSGPWPLEVFVE